MLNINHGHNKELLTACKPLEEYAWFVSQARMNHTANNNNPNKEPLEFGIAIDQTIDEMPEGLQKGLQKGLQEGLLKGKLLDIQNLIDSTGWDTDQVMDMLKIPLNQRATLYAGLSKID